MCAMNCCAKGGVTHEELKLKGPDKIEPNGFGSSEIDCSSSLELFSEKSRIRAVISWSSTW